MVFPGISITDFIKFFLCPNEQKGRTPEKSTPFLPLCQSQDLNRLTSSKQFTYNKHYV